MHIRILFSLLLFSYTVCSQELKKKDIIGTWKVENTQYIGSSHQYKKGIQEVQSIFEHATFTFNKDYSCVLHTEDERMNVMFKDIFWYYNKKQHSIKILKDKGKSDSSGMLNITPVRFNDIIKFRIDNEMVLIVEKQ